jgi:GPH family glycoside/pentoside/hexuronide:cation symporter
MPIKPLPLKKEIAYAAGMMGWSIMTNIIIVMLPYFYLPPNNSGLSPRIPQLLLFGAVNILSIIAASGRLFDAVYDPFIASVSDSSKNPKGRRIPIMKYAVLPAVICCALVFYPLTGGESVVNAWWLCIVLSGFFISVTTYIIPYNALLAELTDSAEQKVKLSSFQQVGFVVGMIVAGLCNNYADLIQYYFHVTDRGVALQYTVFGLCALSGLVMMLPVVAIDERDYFVAKPTHILLLPAIRNTFRNTNFKYYLSLIFYPAINYGSKRFGKKILVIVAFVFLSFNFAVIYFLGKLPFSAEAQMYLLVICGSFPLAALGILPNAILADIAQQDKLASGENHEGMYFAVKYLFVKLGQTAGIAIFAMLTIYGKDPGNDFGLRLNGVFGFVLCLTAMLLFSRFKESKNSLL